MSSFAGVTFHCAEQTHSADWASEPAGTRRIVAQKMCALCFGCENFCLGYVKSEWV